MVGEVGEEGLGRGEAVVEGIEEILLQEGFLRVLVDGKAMRIEDLMADKSLLRSAKELLLIIDRITLHLADAENDFLVRVSDSIEAAFYEGRGLCYIETEDENGRQRHEFSNRSEADGITFEKPNPNFFSFNNPYGACPTCQGFGSTIGILTENVPSLAVMVSPSATVSSAVDVPITAS